LSLNHQLGAGRVAALHALIADSLASLVPIEIGNDDE
jgi:hypothetical protein